MTNIKQTVAKIVPLYRTWTNMSQEQFAKACGVHRTTIVQLESNPTKTRYSTNSSIAHYLQNKQIYFNETDKLFTVSFGKKEGRNDTDGLGVKGG